MASCRSFVSSNHSLLFAQEEHLQGYNYLEPVGNAKIYFILRKDILTL
jgi:hypothetical protein